MAHRRNIKLVDLCKVNTDAFRHMTYPQLRAVQQSIGYINDFSSAELMRASPLTQMRKVERKGRTINALVSKFVYELTANHEIDSRPDTEASRAIYRRRFGEDPAPNERLKASNKREAERLERHIWELQQRAACWIKPDEMVARDAARAGQPERAARIRKKAIIK